MFGLTFLNVVVLVGAVVFVAVSVVFVVAVVFVVGKEDAEGASRPMKKAARMVVSIMFVDCLDFRI